MVKFSPSQASLLKSLGDLKKQQDEAMRQFEYAVSAKREELKQPVKNAVAAAIAEGISQRAIALKGLGYQDVGSLKQYLDTRNDGRMVAPQSFDFAPMADSAPESRAFTLKEHDGSFEELVYVPVGLDSPEVHVYYQKPQGTFESTFKRQVKTGITDTEARDIDSAASDFLSAEYGRSFTAIEGQENN